MPPTSAAILEAVSEAWGLPPAAIVGPARDAGTVKARDAALLLLVELAPLTASGAVRLLGRLPDPHYIHRARARRAADGDFAERLETTRRRLRGEPPRCPHCGGELNQ
jgi:hypothetical protein